MSAAWDRADRLRKAAGWTWVGRSTKYVCPQGSCGHCNKERMTRGARRARPAYHLAPLRRVTDEMGRKRLEAPFEDAVETYTSLREVIAELRQAIAYRA